MIVRHAGSLAVLSLLVAAGCTPDAPSTAPTQLVPGPVAADAKRPGATLLSESTWGGIDSDVTEGAAVGPDGSTVLVGFTRSFGAEIGRAHV